MSPNAIVLAALVALCLCFASGCGGTDATPRPGVTIEPLTATPRSAAPIGGKPATPPGALPTPTPSAPDEPTAVPPTEDAIDVAPTEPLSTPAPPPTSTPTPLALDGSVAPTEGRWIDVNVTTYTVRLMDGSVALEEIAPVGVGAEIDTGVYASTQTGLFYVHTKIEELAYDPPYDTYISHWVGYDIDRANGFHSFLKDEAGTVVDPSTGRVSNGCIRTGAPEAIFDFASEGMPVWVHW